MRGRVKRSRFDSILPTAGKYGIMGAQAFLAGGMDREMTDGQLWALIACLYLGAFIIVGICIVPDRKARKKYKREFLFRARFIHADGLNLPTKAKCDVICLRSRIVIEANGQEFSLPVEKIVDVSIMKKIDIQKIYARLSLIYDMRVVQKDELLVFTYVPDRENESETRYILFNYKYFLDAKRFTHKFRKLKRNAKIRVDL